MIVNVARAVIEGGERRKIDAQEGDLVRMSQGRMLGALSAILLSACSNGPTVYQDPSAMAVLSPTQNSSVHGVATFVRSGGVAVVNLNMAGFKPNTVHGLHIHDSGDCTARDASSAGGHFNPASAQHGGASGSNRHMGDLGNITADAKGEVLQTFSVSDIAFGTGTDSIVGRGLVFHADQDDLKSQPAGNSGARVACGLIVRNPDRVTYASATRP